jgi:cytochrome c553
MKHTIPYLAILSVILYGIYNAQHHTPTRKLSAKSSDLSSMRESRELHAKKELARIDTPDYTYHYIIDVINHGSQNLHFKEKEIMEGGFVSKEDAPGVACYVLSLADETCPAPSSADAAMYFSSNCAGCHGEDGKGIHGTYPDLTRRPLLGIQKRKAFLQKM